MKWRVFNNDNVATENILGHIQKGERRKRYDTVKSVLLKFWLFLCWRKMLRVMKKIKFCSKSIQLILASFF